MQLHVAHSVSLYRDCEARKWEWGGEEEEGREGVQSRGCKYGLERGGLVDYVSCQPFELLKHSISFSPLVFLVVHRYRYQLEAFVDKVKGRTPQTWVTAEDSIANMEAIEKVYEKVRHF